MTDKTDLQCKVIKRAIH